MYLLEGQRLDNYQALANSVMINKENRLIGNDHSLTLIGKGRSAFVFQIKSTEKVIKVFFPNQVHLAIEEAIIYQKLSGIHYYPNTYDFGANYIVLDYIEGKTLFDCLSQGIIITERHVKEIDRAIELARNQGLNPSDIHLRNILLTYSGDIKVIDVARFRQRKSCLNWHYLKKSYYQLYYKSYFPKKLPTTFLNAVGYLYKKRLIPFYRR